jgi:hypothetical protein
MNNAIYASRVVVIKVRNKDLNMNRTFLQTAANNQVIFHEILSLKNGLQNPLD